MFVPFSNYFIRRQSGASDYFFYFREFFDDQFFNFFCQLGSGTAAKRAAAGASDSQTDM